MNYITPEALDEMKLEKEGNGYGVPGEPNIYIDFWGNGSARVYTIAAPGAEVDFPHVNTVERLLMLLDAIKYDTMAEAIAAWNQRVEPKVTVEIHHILTDAPKGKIVLKKDDES